MLGQIKHIWLLCVVAGVFLCHKTQQEILESTETIWRSILLFIYTGDIKPAVHTLQRQLKMQHPAEFFLGSAATLGSHHGGKFSEVCLQE